MNYSLKSIQLPFLPFLPFRFKFIFFMSVIFLMCIGCMIENQECGVGFDRQQGECVPSHLSMMTFQGSGQNERVRENESNSDHEHHSLMEQSIDEYSINGQLIDSSINFSFIQNRIPEHAQLGWGGRWDIPSPAPLIYSDQLTFNIPLPMTLKTFDLVISDKEFAEANTHDTVIPWEGSFVTETVLKNLEIQGTAIPDHYSIYLPLRNLFFILIEAHSQIPINTFSLLPTQEINFQVQTNTLFQAYLHICGFTIPANKSSFSSFLVEIKYQNQEDPSASPIPFYELVVIPHLQWTTNNTLPVSIGQYNEIENLLTDLILVNPDSLNPIEEKAHLSLSRIRIPSGTIQSIRLIGLPDSQEIWIMGLNFFSGE